MVLVKLAILVNTVIHRWSRPRVFCVPPVGHRNQEAPNVKHVKLEKPRTTPRLATLAKIVALVNIVKAVWIQQLAQLVLQVFFKTQ